MKARNIAIGFFLFLTAGCIAQQSSWKAEHYSFFLVPPNATEIRYVDWPRGVHQLTYKVEEPYPASYVLGFICADVQQKGWTLQPAENKWQKVGSDVPGKSRAQYRWSRTWGNEDNEGLEYTLDYTDSKSDHYLRTLHVEAVYSDGVAARQNAARLQKEFEKEQAEEKLHKQVLRYEYGAGIVAYFMVLVAPVILSAKKPQYSAFYRGPQAWLTSINVVLFGTLLIPLLWFGTTAISAISGKEAALATGVAGAVVMILFARIGYSVGAIGFFLAIGICRSKEIPKPVKIMHCALSAATIIFFVLCAQFFSGPLIRW